ncbi:unnamed protein product [Chrysoparadoxa australica]
MTYQDAVYEGAWVDNLRQGEGVWRSLNRQGGCHYTGSWVDDLPHGHGVAHYNDGSNYTGQWCRGSPGGEHGEMLFNDGKFYSGAWKDGKPDSFGTMWDPYGGKFTGEWQDGEPVSEGTYSSLAGGAYSGVWVSDQSQWKFKRTGDSVMSQHIGGGLIWGQESFTLTQVCVSPVLREKLIHWAELHHREEAIRFILQARAIKARCLKPPQPAFIRACHNLVEAFIKEGSPCEVNVPNAIRERAMAAAGKTVDCFSEIEKEVTKHLAANALDIFKVGKDEQPSALMREWAKEPFFYPPGRKEFAPLKSRLVFANLVGGPSTRRNSLRGIVTHRVLHRSEKEALAAARREAHISLTGQLSCEAAPVSQSDDYPSESCQPHRRSANMDGIRLLIETGQRSSIRRRGRGRQRGDDWEDQKMQRNRGKSLGRLQDARPQATRTPSPRRLTTRRAGRINTDLILKDLAQLQLQREGRIASLSPLGIRLEHSKSQG